MDIQDYIEEYQGNSPVRGDRSDSKEQSIYYIKFAIEIEDSGVGISKENLKGLFTDFNKLDEHSKINPTGTGLGLSICKLIVEKMRGKVREG